MADHFTTFDTVDPSAADNDFGSEGAIALPDQFGAGNKFITPTVVNGKVYVGTPGAVAVFGLLH